MNQKIKNLKKIFGVDSPEIKLVYPKEFLSKFETLIEKQNENNAKNIADFSANISKTFDGLLNNINEINKRISDTDKKIEGIKEVKVTNFPQIKIPEQKEFPKEIEVKKPSWYEKFIPDKLMEVINRGFKENSKSFETALDRHKKLENALAVRLADSQLKTFYNAIAYASSSGGGTATGLATEATLAAIKTAVELIDNIVGSINGAGAPVIDSYTKVAINLAAGANQSLVSAPGANKQIWVYGIGFTVNVAGTVSFQDEDDTAITGVMQIGATGGMTVAPSGNFAMPLWKLATNKALEVDVVTSELDGWLTYAIVSV